MIEKICQSHKYNFCYDATKLKKMVKFYVPTWTLFAGPVTNIPLYIASGVESTYIMCMYIYFRAEMKTKFSNYGKQVNIRMA